MEITILVWKNRRIQSRQVSHSLFSFFTYGTLVLTAVKDPLEIFRKDAIARQWKEYMV